MFASKNEFSYLFYVNISLAFAKVEHCIQMFFAANAELNIQTLPE